MYICIFKNDDLILKIYSANGIPLDFVQYLKNHIVYCLDLFVRVYDVSEKLIYSNYFSLFLDDIDKFYGSIL